MKTLIKFVLTGCLAASLIGCASTSTPSASSTAAQSSNSDTVAKTQRKSKSKGKLIIDGSNAAPGSLFSKVSLKMGVKQVGDTIGFGTDSKRYSTGKDWIPYYFGSDGSRTEYFYKGEGRLIFGGNERLLKIIVDPTEDGYS